MNHINSRYAAGLIEKGLDVAWLKSLESGAAKCSNRHISFRLHDSEVIRPAGMERNGAIWWAPGKFYKKFMGLVA